MKRSFIQLSFDSEDVQALTGTLEIYKLYCHFCVKIVDIPNSVIQIKIKCFTAAFIFIIFHLISFNFINPLSRHEMG